MPPKKNSSKRKQPRQAKRKQSAKPKSKTKLQKRAPMNPELAAYAAVSIDPMADVAARIPDSADYNTVAFRSITEFTVTVGATGYVNVSFNPVSAASHYAFNTAVDAFPDPVNNAFKYSGITANYRAIRVVSAGLYAIPNFSLSQLPGISFCVNNPRYPSFDPPTVAVMRTMQDAGPRSLAKGCFLRWKKNDYIETAFINPSAGTLGPLILFRAEGLTEGSKLVIRLVVNYEAIVAAVSQGFIRSSPSPKFPQQKDSIDNFITSIPNDSTVAQMSTGGPTPSTAKSVGVLTKIANGVSGAMSSFLGKANPISLVSDGLAGLFSSLGI